MRAARRVGELLGDPPKRGGKPGRGSNVRGSDIGKQRASEFRKLSEIPLEAFEAHVASKVKNGKQPSPSHGP